MEDSQIIWLKFCVYHKWTMGLLLKIGFPVSGPAAAPVSNHRLYMLELGDGTKSVHEASLRDQYRC